MGDRIFMQCMENLKSCWILKRGRFYQASFPNVLWHSFESGMIFTSVNCWKTGSLLANINP